MENNDDGSLECLNIQPDKDRKYFHCDEITQQKLLNKSFWVIDFIGNLNTRYGKERYLVKIKFDLNNSDECESELRKNSAKKHTCSEKRESHNKNTFKNLVRGLDGQSIVTENTC